MKLKLTNQTSSALPIMSTDEGGWADVLQPNTPYTLTHNASDVIIIGDKPDVREQIEQGIATIGAVAREIINAFKSRLGGRAGAPMVSAIIENDGDKSVRVILGDGVSDWVVNPGEMYPASAHAYLELRELGDVATPYQPEAA
jgi:hypothetical protein